MTTNENELKQYIDTKLEKNFKKLATLKNSSKSIVVLFRHNKTGKKLVKRISNNRNDEIYRLLKSKTSDNLCQIYEVCSDDKHLIILEEFIEGNNLSELIQKTNINKKTACKYVIQLCDALTFLHKNGIIHRDIKPENIIINKDNNAILIDYSISRMISNTNESDTDILGTIGYAAPEQYGITQSNKTTDIYSLGVLLNIMLTGEHPAVTVPKGAIKKIINKATSTQISKRYQSAEQMKKDLILFSRI